MARRLAYNPETGALALDIRESIWQKLYREWRFYCLRRARRNNTVKLTLGGNRGL